MLWATMRKIVLLIQDICLAHNQSHKSKPKGEWLSKLKSSDVPGRDWQTAKDQNVCRFEVYGSTDRRKSMLTRICLKSDLRPRSSEISCSCLKHDLHLWLTKICCFLLKTNKSADNILWRKIASCTEKFCIVYRKDQIITVSRRHLIYSISCSTNY